MSFFKKKDEDRKEAYKPSNDNVSAKEGSSGGKGGGEPAAPSVDPSTKAGKAAIKKSMDDGRFGYGYIDRNTGVEVPWYIDMINGGGANAAGSEFVSPFAELPLGGGMASMPTNLANAAGIAPYGYNQPRKYAQAGMQGYPTAAPAPSPTGSGSTSSPNLMNIPNSMTDDDLGLPSGPAIAPDVYAIGRGGEMAGAMSLPPTSGPILAGHNMPPIQGASPAMELEAAVNTAAPTMLPIEAYNQRMPTPRDPKITFDEFAALVQKNDQAMGIRGNNDPEVLRRAYFQYLQRTQ